MWGFRCLLNHGSKCTADRAEGRGKGQTSEQGELHYLKIQREFEGLHFSSQCFWTRAEDLLSLLWVVPVSLPEGTEEVLLSCQLSICWLENREIKQVIPKSTKRNTALAGSRWWLRNTACFFIGLDALYLPEDFFSFIFSSVFPFPFCRVRLCCWECVTSHCWAWGAKAMSGLCFQADNQRIDEMREIK